MKTNFEDLKRLKKTSVPENQFRTFLSDNPIDNVLEDLSDLEIFQKVNACQDTESLIKWLKMVYYIPTDDGPFPTKTIIESIENFQENPDQIHLEIIIRDFGIRSKMAEIMFSNTITNPFKNQMTLEL